MRLVVALLLFVWPMWKWLGHLLRRASSRWHRRPVQHAVYCNVLRAGFRGRTKPAWVTQEVVRLKALMPNAGCRQIATVFNRRFAVRRQMTVSKSFVAGAIRTHRYEIEVVRRRIKHRRPRPVPRNRVWGLDMTGKADALGHVHGILGVVDHGTRRALFLDTLLN